MDTLAGWIFYFLSRSVNLMKKFIRSLAIVFVLALSVLAAESFTLPKDHAEMMKEDYYKKPFERFAALMEKAKEKLDSQDYAALEREYEEAVKVAERESVPRPGLDFSKEEQFSLQLDAWEATWRMQSDRIDQIIKNDQLKRNAEGAQGFYRNASSGGWMTVEEGEEKNVYVIMISATEEGGEPDMESTGVVTGSGKLEGKKMSIDYYDPDSKITVTFDGETAKVETSKAFKESVLSPWEYVMDGEYVREKK
jgi:hypothetical protein